MNKQVHRCRSQYLSHRSVSPPDLSVLLSLWGQPQIATYSSQLPHSLINFGYLPISCGWALISVSCKRMTRTALFLAVSYKWEPGPCKKHCSALIGCQDLEGIPWCLPQSDQQWFYLPTWHTASGLNGQVSVLFSLTEISRKRLLEVYCSFISVCVFVVHFCVHLFSSPQKNPWVIGYAINFLWNTVIGEKTFHSTLCTSVKN